MKEEITSKGITNENDAVEICTKKKLYITECAKEALGTRHVNINVERNEKPWLI